MLMAVNPRSLLHDRSPEADLRLRLSRLLEEYFDATDCNMVWCPTCRVWWKDESNTIGGDNEQWCETCAKENAMTYLLDNQAWLGPLLVLVLEVLVQIDRGMQ